MAGIILVSVLVCWDAQPCASSRVCLVVIWCSEKAAVVDDGGSTILERGGVGLGEHRGWSGHLPEVALKTTTSLRDKNLLNDIVDGGKTDLDVTHPAFLLVVICSFDILTVAPDIDDVRNVCIHVV